MKRQRQILEWVLFVALASAVILTVAGLVLRLVLWAF
jgi:hypothetical protein